jgi:UDPglucose 6-dehydrogenase
MSERRDAPRRSIAVVGAGYVGLVSAVGFARMGHAIELVETDPDRLADLRNGRVPFSEPGVQEALTAALASGDLTILDKASDTTAEIVLICVGTPIDDRGHADVSAVEAVLAELAALQARPITVVRSTTPVGTCQRLLRDGHVADESRFFTVPEFLAQGSALTDFAAPHRVVIGCARSADRDAQATLVELFGFFGAPVRLVTLEEAELIKNGANAFLALKISFVNELAGLAERSGADIGPVLEAIGLDPRIGSTYMRPSFGFGGSCLPKELQTIAMSGLERGLAMHVTAAATEANLAHQRLFAERIDATLGGVAGRRIALLGLAFKAGTDDIRYSPAVGLARWLIEHEARVHAYDPAAGGRASRAVPGLIVQDTVMEALAGADAAIIATEWPEFKDLDWAHARGSMASPVVIDGRRLLDPAVMRDLGFDYERVGSPMSGAAAIREASILGSQA